MKIGGFKKKYKRARLMAVVMSLLMVLTLFGDVGYKPVADDATTPTAADFMKVVDTISVTPGSSVDSEISMDSNLKIHLVFTLPDDGANFNGKTFDIETDYLFSFNLNEVKAEQNGVTNEAVSALVTSQNESNLPIVMGGQIVGRYSISGGIVTLDFSEGIETLQDSTISRQGTFDFTCSLNQDAFADEGGEYILKFDTQTLSKNPTVFLDEKDFIKSGVTVDKQDAVFDVATKTATYTIVVNNTSGGPLTDLVISDTMGSNLTYVDSSVTCTATTVTENISNNQNVTFTMATVPEGETTFTYKCTVADGAFTGANSINGGASGTNNTITATLDGKKIFLDNSSTKNDSTSVSVKKDVLDKIYNGYDSTYNTVSWTIVINAGSDTFDLGGYTFTDTLGAGLTYVPDSVSVTGDNSDVVAGLTSVINGTSQASSYVFPQGTTGQYTITYKTTVPAHDGKVTYDNEATVSNGIFTDSDKAYTDPIGENISGKAFAGDAANLQTDGNGDLIIPWSTTIKVPQGTTSMTYSDYVNTWYDENGLGFYTTTTNEKGIFNITYSGTNSGTLTVDTDYTVTKNSDTSYSIEFNQACLATINDGNTTITISYSTIGNYAHKPSDSGTKYRNHYNLSVSDGNTTLNESGSAETQYTPTTLIDKSVAKYDEKEHTITWAIKVNASNTNVLKDLVLTDDISSMRYWGYSNGDAVYEHDYTGANPMKAYIVGADYQTYTINITEAEQLDSTTDTPKYQYKIDFTDGSLSNVNTWMNPKLTDDPTALSQSFTIYYTTQVQGKDLYSNNTNTYKNSVQAEAKVNDDPNPITSSASATQTLTTEILTKECVQTTDDGVAVLTYTIQVNPDGLKLNPDASEPYYLVEDTLPASLVYMPSKTVVTDSETGEVIALADSADEVKNNTDGSKYHASYADNVITFTVPDQRPLTITYKVTMLSDSMAGGVTYVNSVKLAKPYVSNESLVSNREYKSVASSAANMVGRKLFIVDKIDALDTNEHLSGATFEAKEYVYDGSAWVESGNIFEGTTGVNGTVGADTFTVKEGDSNAEISTNRIYEIRETVAPYGYELSNKVYKIIVVDTNNPITDTAQIPGDTFRITAGTSLLFSDMPGVVLPENELIITKTYFEADGITPVANQTEKAVIEIYEGNLTLEQCKSGSHTPLTIGDLGNGFTYAKSGDVITLNRIPAGTYTVYEKSAPAGYDILTKVYHFTVSNYEISWEGEAASLNVAKEIDNKKTFENEIVINKEYYTPSGVKITDKANIPVKAEFTYKQTHYYDGDSGNYVAVANGTATNIPTADDGFTYTISTLPAGKYMIDEVVLDAYEANALLPLTVEVATDGKITIKDAQSNVLADGTSVNVAFTVRNDIKDNKITINKTYYAADGTQIDAANLEESLSVSDGVTNQQKVIFTLYRKDASGAYVVATNADYESNNKVFASGSTKTDAYIWANLEPGEYRLVESLVQSPIQDNTKYESLHTVEFIVNKDYTISTSTSATGSYEQEVDVDNRILDATRCRFYLTKYIADQSGDLTVDEEGNVFTFKMEKSDGSGNWNDVTFTYSTARHRWEATGLTAGTYRVTETIATPAGDYIYYNKASQINIVIEDKNGDATITSITYSGESTDFWTTTVLENIENVDIETVIANVVNKPSDNKITVTKKYYQPDKSTEITSLENYAEFTLYKESAVGSGNFVAVETMKADGNNAYIFGKLEPGSYKISETYTPDGFVNASDVKFTVNADYSITVTSSTDDTISVSANATLDVAITAKNFLENSFIWTKKYTSIDGTEITDTVQKNTLFAATEFKVYDSTGNIEQAVTVTNDGSAYTFKVSELNAGTYVIKETKTPEGYIKSGDIKLTISETGKISVTYAGTRTDFTDLLNNGTHNVTATLYNRQDTNQLIINKTYYEADGTTQIPMNEVLSFASFTLYDNSGNEVTNVTKQFSQTMGTYVFSNIPQGSYKIVEKSMDGYETIGELTFTVDVNGKIDYTEGAGWTGGTDNAVKATVNVKNTKVPNGFTLRKLYYGADGTDITNSYVNSGEPQASFTLKATDGSGMTYNLTATDNLYTATNISYGSYELVETVPAGFGQVNGTITVNVAENGTITASYNGDVNDFHVTSQGTTTGMEILFTNHETANSFTVNKTYVSATGESIDPADLSTSEQAVFKLYAYYGTAYQREITESTKVKIDVTKGVYSFVNLDAGQYTIVETPGIGFTGAGNITFTVNADNTITNVHGATTSGNSDSHNKFVSIENERAPFDNSVAVTKTFIDMSGTDATNDTMLQNTSFVMKDSDGNIVTGFVYDDTHKCWLVEHLEPGTYVISETNTPDGYVAISDINVTITKVAPLVTEITMSYTGLNTNDVTYVYDTTQNPTDTRYMEIKAVNRQAVDNKFVIDKKFISVYGKEITSANVLATYLQSTQFTYKAEGGTNATNIPFDDVTGQYVLEDLQPGTYIISETAHSDFIAISDIKLVVDNDGSLEVIYAGDAGDIVVTESQTELNTTSVEVNNYSKSQFLNISKVDITNGAELPGAKLTITNEDGKVIEEWTSSTGVHKMAVGGFIPNKEYTLTEVTAPYGYDIAESIVFKTDELGNIYVKGSDGTFELVTDNTIVMEDAPKYVTISKVDLVNGAELPGAKLTITDKDGKIVDTWTSTTTPHQMLMTSFKADAEYTLTEVTAPEGYEVAESIIFKIDTSGTIYIKSADGTFTKLTTSMIVMKDAPSATSSSEVETGDSTPIVLLFVLVMLTGLGIIYMMPRKRRI